MDCDVQDLADAAECVDCLTTQQLDKIETDLLCQWLDSLD